MPSVRHSFAYIDLAPPLEDIERTITTRTEIRKAKKSGVSVRVYRGKKPEAVAAECAAILARLLAHECVPYSSVFDTLIRDESNLLLVATVESAVASFIVIAPESRNAFFAGEKTGVLELSATSDVYRSRCPNYLLIWNGIELLKEAGFRYFNLGLLTYEDCPDPDLERVAFYKRKWGISVGSGEKQVGVLKYLYLRFGKRFRMIKAVAYIAARIKAHFLRT